MSDIITTLHPENDDNINLYPNIKSENIPDGSITDSKLSEEVNNMLANAVANISQPTFVTTLPTSDNGLVVYTDGYLYRWNGTQYVTTNVLYQANLDDYALDETSTNGIQNGIVTKAFKHIAKSFQHFDEYLYKKNTYLNASNVETTLDGFDLYRIPIKEFCVLTLNWNPNNTFYETLNFQYAIKLEDNNGVFTNIIGYGYHGFGCSTDNGNALFRFDNTTNAKYLYVCIKRDRFDTITFGINTYFDFISNDDNKVRKIITASFNDTGKFLHSSLYIYRDTNLITHLVVSTVKCIHLLMRKGDKIIFNGEFSGGLNFNGEYSNISGSTITSIGNETEFTATEDVFFTTFLQEAPATRTITLIPSEVNDISNNISLDDESNFKNLNGVAFGTSLTYRSQTTGGYLTKLSELSEITFDNQGIGSSVILAYTGLASILEAVKSYTNYASKRVCLLEGFVNDWIYNHDKLGTYTDTSETTVCGCFRSAINYIYSQNPNITLFLILDHYGRNYGANCASTALNVSNITQYSYYEEIAKVAESLGVIVIKEYAISEISENTPQYLMDNIHCNALGAIRSAYAIWSIMKKYYPNNV